LFGGVVVLVAYAAVAFLLDRRDVRRLRRIRSREERM
jgi:hypothetical protein